MLSDQLKLKHPIPKNPQYAPAKHIEPTKNNIKYIQRAVGFILYYARALDNTVLMALSNPDAKIKYITSNMILHIYSDGSYLSVPKARSRAGGFIFLSNNLIQLDKTTLNRAINVLCKILKDVMK